MIGQTKSGTFYKQWLLHGFIYWAVTEAYRCFIYYQKLLENGNYLWHEDGSPTTVWDSFYEANRYQYILPKALLFTFLVEILRTRFYRNKKFQLFVFAAIGGGMIWSIFLATYAAIKHKESFDLAHILNTGVIIDFVAYAIIYAVAREFITQKLYKKNIRLAKLESEINGLKAQVNPHFFFNTFNYVYGTAMQENAVKTAKAIEMMTEMMRYTMSVMNEKLVSLKDELKFLKNYIELQLLRLPERKNISIEIDLLNENESNGMIAPMLIIPFVENAFKYAISIDQDCFIHIKIGTENEMLKIEIHNSISNNKTASGLGTGISNAVQRLKLLYPGKHFFERSNSDETFRVTIHIPLE